MPPKKGKKHVLRVIRELLQHEPVGHSTDIGEALDYLLKVQKRRCVTFLPNCPEGLWSTTSPT